MSKLRFPDDIEAERALVSTLAAPGALDPESSFQQAHQAIIALSEDYFVHPANRAIFRGIKQLYVDAIEINPLTLKSCLEKNGTLNAVGGYGGIIESLGGEEVGKPMVLVDRLASLWRARQTIRYCADAAKAASSEELAIDEVIGDLSGKITSMHLGSKATEWHRASSMLDRLQAKEAFKRVGERKVAYFGLDAIDDAIEAAPEHVVMIAARPACGKSALTIQSLWHTARKGNSCLLVSLEMNKDEVESRLASWGSGESQRKFRSGDYSDIAVFTLGKEHETLDRILIWDHPSGVQWNKVESIIRDAVRLHSVSCVFIDHVLLIAKPKGDKGANDAARWTELSHSLRRLAQELKICIVELCQLNRKDDGIEPMLSSLRDSGGWEEDANAVIMLWPKEVKASGDFTEQSSIFIKVEKNRSGISHFKREVCFQGAINRFSIVEQTTDPPRFGRGFGKS